MKWINWLNKNGLDDELQRLELKLQSTLTPVNPRPEFVAGLRKNLLRQVPNIDLALEYQNPKYQTGLLIAGGVVGALAMFLTGVRGVVSILGMIGLFISMIKKNSQDTQVPSNFAR